MASVGALRTFGAPAPLTLVVRPRLSMLTGFTFSRIVIIQSLEPHEVATGRILSEFIASSIDSADVAIPIQVINCGYADQFLQIVEILITEATAGSTPLLHVECHGDPQDGLEFENGSTLSWERVAQAMLKLNIASKFNLLAIFSACFGAHFLGQMGAINPAPCWCMIAPTETVDPGEILLGFRTFYSTLFRENDMGYAVKAISQCSLSNGRWMWEPAELWFENVVTGYVKDHCNNSAARSRARALRRKLKEQGHRQSIGSLLRILRSRNRDSLLGHYFETYFLTHEIPENIQRFSHVKVRVNNTLAELRSTGRYAI